MYLDEAEYNKFIGMRGHFIVPDNFPEMGAFFVVDDPEGVALLNKKRGDEIMVMRYDFNIDDAFQDDGKCGDFVRYGDYILLEQENEKLQDEIVRMQGMITECMGGEDDE